MMEAEADQLTREAADQCAKSNQLFRANRLLEQRVAEANRRYDQVADEARLALAKFPIDTVRRTLQGLLIKAAILLGAIVVDGILNPRDEQTAQQGDI